MDFNWKIVSSDDTTHSIIVAYWTTEHPEQIQVNIVAPPVGTDITEYITRFVPAFDKPNISYQAISVGTEGTATAAPELTISPISNNTPLMPIPQTIDPLVTATQVEAIVQRVISEMASATV